MVGLYEATKTPPNCYRVGLNCRVRENAIVGAFKPVRIDTPDAIHQAVFTFDDQLLVVIAGSTYKLVGNEVQFLNVPSMDGTVDQVFHELVPAPSNFFMKQGGATETYNSVISTYAEAAILQDGINKPALINSNLSSRRAQGYDEWSYNQPEYVPIGKQMAFSGNKLYVASPDGRKIYQSVSGRPLDFVLNIDDSTGAKQGDANTTYIAVSAAALTALVPAQGSGFLAFTHYQGYTGLPDGNFPEFFGEPYIRPDNLFPVGAVGQQSFTFSKGESLFVSSAGIQEFNQVMQQQRQSNASPFGAPILSILNRPLTRVATCTVDDYVFFGVSTIYGDGILVYDNIIEAFVSIDLVGTVKEFAVLRTLTGARVFFITTANELFELPLYSGERSSFAIYFGEYASQQPCIQIKPERFYVELTSVRANGSVSVRTITDKKIGNTNIIGVVAQTPAANLLSQAPTIFTTGDSTQNETLTANFTETVYGYAVGVELVCSVDARLVSVRADFVEKETPRPVALDGHQIELAERRFLVLGNIRADQKLTGACHYNVVVGNEYIAQAPVGSKISIQNGDKVFVVHARGAMRFTAQADVIYTDATATIYDFNSLIPLLSRGNPETVNDPAPSRLIITGNLGNDELNHEAFFNLFERMGVPVSAVTGKDEWTNGTISKDFFSQSGSPKFSQLSTDYVDFYLLNIDPANSADTSSTGKIAHWIEASIKAATIKKFNVVVVGSPPYSESSLKVAALQWNFRRMGVHLVLSTGEAYERYVYNNVYYINVGTGRASGLSATQGLAVQGIVELRALPTILAAEFYDTTRATRDRIAIVG